MTIQGALLDRRPAPLAQVVEYILSLKFGLSEYWRYNLARLRSQGYSLPHRRGHRANSQRNWLVAQPPSASLPALTENTPLSSFCPVVRLTNKRLSNSLY